MQEQLQQKSRKIKFIESKNEKLSRDLDDERELRRQAEKRISELQAQFNDSQKRIKYLQEEISNPGQWQKRQTSEDFGRELGPGAAQMGAQKHMPERAGTFKAPLAQNIAVKPRFR